MTPRERRLHGQEAAGALSDLPLCELGVARVEALRLDDAGPGRVHVDRPHLVDGRAPPRDAGVLAAPLPARPAATAPAARFEWDGTTLRAQVALPSGTSLYGCGLAMAPLERSGRSVRFYNSDVWRYGPSDPALYASHPWVLAVHADGSATGLLADTPDRGAATLVEGGVEFSFEGAPFDLVRVEGDGPEAVLERLAQLVGAMPLPPLWALGYQQSRWGWERAERVLEVARTFRERDLPCDAIWLDIDHMRERQSFTFDPERFPDPEGLLDELARLGFARVAIVDPGLAVDEAGRAAELAAGHFVRGADGAPLVGRVWPGPCHFPDFTREATRAWWAERCAAFARRGLDGLWIDMNEPVLFRTPTKTLPDDAHHAGDARLPADVHRRYHNLYAQLMARATRSGLERAHPDERPFVLTRAAHLGTAREAAQWTGDNQACWEDLRAAIPMVLSLGLCGQPFAGADLGGFDGDPEPELYARWFELGALLPFARGHSERSACAKEPWAFGPEVEARVRDALCLRLELLPCLYTAFHAAATRGLPVARPLFLADATDARLRALDDAFLVGPLLVAPIVERGARARDVVLPRGGWYPYAGGARLAAQRVEAADTPGRPPLFARAGAIVPTAPGLGRAADLPGAALALEVFLDDDGRAAGTLYQDAGRGLQHRRGAWRELQLSAETTREGACRVRARASRGAFDGTWPASARVHAPDGSHWTSDVERA